MSFISLRVPQDLMAKVHRLKAKLMLARSDKVSDAEVVRTAVEFALKNESGLLTGKKPLMDYCGIVSGGPSNAAEDLHDVLYGEKR